MFVKPGSTISLTCSIKLFSSPPTNIQWYKDTRALNLDSARGGVSLENEKTPIGTKSTLIVTKVINCIIILENSNNLIWFYRLEGMTVETIHATQVVDMQHLSLFMLLMVNKFVLKYVVVELSGAYLY